MRPRVIGLWVVLIVLFVAFYQFFAHTNEELRHLSFTDFMKLAAEHKVQNISIKEEMIRGVFVDTNERFDCVGPKLDCGLVQQLQSLGLNVNFVPGETQSLWGAIVEKWLPWALVFVLLVWRRKQSAPAAPPPPAPPPGWPPPPAPPPV